MLGVGWFVEWSGGRPRARVELVDVEGWAFKGGAELGTKRDVPPIEQFYALGRAIERNEIDALLVIGGMNAYLGRACDPGREGSLPGLPYPDAADPRVDR